MERHNQTTIAQGGSRFSNPSHVQHPNPKSFSKKRCTLALNPPPLVQHSEVKDVLQEII